MRLQELQESIPFFLTTEGARSIDMRYAMLSTCSSAPPPPALPRWRRRLRAAAGKRAAAARDRGSIFPACEEYWFCLEKPGGPFGLFGPPRKSQLFILFDKIVKFAKKLIKE